MALPKVQSSQTVQGKVQIVADDYERTRKQIQISMSEAQVEATDKAAQKAGMNRSEFIRHVLSQVLDQWPDDLQGVGKYERK